MNLKRDFDAVAAWGVTVTIAYLFTPYVKALGVTAVAVEYQILVLWVLLMAPPIYMSYQEGKGPLGWKTLNPIWAFFMIVGLLGNFAGQISLSGDMLFYSYYQKWFFLPAALLAYTAYKMSDASRRIYAAATALNIVAGLYLFVEPTFQLYAFQTAAVIQGLPMLLDWYVRKS